VSQLRANSTPGTAQASLWRQLRARTPARIGDRWMSVVRIWEHVLRQERAALEMSARHNSDSAAYRPRQSLADFAIGSTW